MAKTATKDKEAESPLIFDVMPGADPLEQGEAIDLSFDDPEPEEVADDVSDEAEETVDEAEETGDEEEEAEADAEEEVDEAEDEEEIEAETEADAAEEEESDDSEPDAPLENSDADRKPAKRKQKQPMVPKSRLDEVLAKQKALQKQLEALQSQQQDAPEAPEAYDFDAKEQEYMDAVLDGDKTKAAALRKEIREAERTQVEYEMGQKVTKTTTQNQQLTALQQAAAEIESAFPVFDQNSDEFNKEYTDEVVSLRDAFITSGANAVDALTRAVTYVVKSYGLDAALETSEEPAQKAVKQRRTVADKVKVARSQPPAVRGEGAATRGKEKIDPMQMTEDEFNALPEATLKRLRGDIL